MTRTEHFQQANAFVGKLDALPPPEGTRRLAELRRALIEPHSLHRILQAVGDQLADVPDWALDDYALVAPLVALHKQKLPLNTKLPRFGQEARGARRTSMGESVRRLRRQLKVGQDSLDLRFGALLNADYEDLGYHLRQMVQRLAGHDAQIPIDYARLIVDVSAWSHSERKVQHAWAKHYWQHPTVPAAAN